MPHPTPGRYARAMGKEDWGARHVYLNRWVSKISMSKNQCVRRLYWTKHGFLNAFLISGSPVLRWFFLYLCLSLIERWALDHSIWEAVRWESMGNSDMQTVPENSALQTLGASSDFKWFIYFCFLPLKVIKQNVCGSFHCIPWICDTLHFQIGRRHQTNEGVTPRRTELALLVFQFLCEIGNGSQTTNDVFKMVF